MKIVILNGSPHENGYTANVCKALFNDIEAEVKTYYAYDVTVNNCIGCNYCSENVNKCVFDGEDDFRAIMADVIDCDLFVLASPLHFSGFTAKLLAVISRMQVYFPLKYEFKQPLPFKDKRGLTIAVGGNDYPAMFDAVKAVDRVIFMHCNATDNLRLLLKGTDQYNKEDFVSHYQKELNKLKDDLKTCLNTAK